MAAEKLDESAATIYLSTDGTRIRIPRALYALLLEFRSAMSLADFRMRGLANEKAARAILQLRKKGFLVPEDDIPESSPRWVTDPPVRLFDVPVQKMEAAEAQVVVLGIPWDFGDPDAAGARRGSLAIRDASLQMLYRLSRETGRPLGWFDTDRHRFVLEGVSIADAGDVIVHHGESRSSVFGRAQNAWEVLTRDGALPVLLGGDASVAEPLIVHMQRNEPLDVIHVGRTRSGRSRSPTIGGRAWLHDVSLLPNVERVVCVGSVVPSDPFDPAKATGVSEETLSGKVTSLPVDAILKDGRWSVEPAQGAARRVHVGIDMAVMANALDGTDSGLLDYRDVRDLLCMIGRTHTIVSLDLCGLNPWHPCWNTLSMTALHLLMTALSAAKDPM
ncbi:hypothetical protein BTJ49_01995 [Oleiagrimonas sp. MCCC 1A03011]|nr:hypothetical protein BTJ49_01995 [Oleiagrimonas sp. MCCC 1A03011]